MYHFIIIICHVIKCCSYFIKALKSSEKTTADADTAKSEEHPQFSRTLSADDTDAAFRERLKNMGKCNYELCFCYFIHRILL